MRRLTGCLIAALALAACEPLPAPPPPGAAPTVAAVSVAPPRDRARAFVDVIAAVEPVAERECRRRSVVLNCDFRIVVDTRPGLPANAFQTLDDSGRPVIAFTAALIEDARNTDELAFVLGHEASHHIAGHLQQQRRNAYAGAVVFGQLAGLAGQGEAEIRAAQEIGAFVGIRTFSQEFELEADALGTIIAARSGFDPVRGSEFFFRIPDPGNRFLSTHPPNDERVRVVRDTAAQLGL